MVSPWNPAVFMFSQMEQAEATDTMQPGMSDWRAEARAWLLSARNWAVVNLSPRQIWRDRVRRRIAAAFISGDGLEIGALHLPLALPKTARVRYVDYKPTGELVEMYRAGYRFFDLAPVSVVDDGERLNSIENESIDFLVANHVLEHSENPIATLMRWLDVLQVGGILFMAIPDKRYTFDRDRPLTEVDHLLRDYVEGPGWSRDQHFEEYCRFVQRPSEEDLPANIARLKKDDIRIHFHVGLRSPFGSCSIVVGIRWISASESS
jgi:SAM-dependent methyltransferase